MIRSARTARKLLHGILALSLLAVPAAANDLSEVHQILRLHEGEQPHDWQMLDGVWDCEDWAMWGRTLLIERGWSPESLAIWVVNDPYRNNARHAVLCAIALCVDRRETSLVPLSAYDGAVRYP